MKLKERMIVLIAEIFSGKMFDLNNFARKYDIDMETVDSLRDQTSASVMSYTQGMIRTILEYHDNDVFLAFLEEIEFYKYAYLIKEINIELLPQGLEIIKEDRELKLVSITSSKELIKKETIEIQGWIEKKLKQIKLDENLSSLDQAISSYNEENYESCIGTLRNFVHGVFSSILKTGPTHFDTALKKMMEDPRYEKLASQKFGRGRFVPTLDQYLALMGSHPPIKKPKEIDARFALMVTLFITRYFIELTEDSK